MIPELRIAIFNIGKSITELSQRFYSKEAPRDVDNPYAVFSQVTNPASRDTKTKFEDVYININYYDSTEAGVEAAAEAGKAKFDDSEVLFNAELSEYHLDRIERQFSRDGKFEDLFMISHQYKLELTKL